jgi:hypothetical protein
VVTEATVLVLDLELFVGFDALSRNSYRPGLSCRDFMSRLEGLTEKVIAVDVACAATDSKVVRITAWVR